MINFDTIPDEFKNLKRFALWARVKRGDKENKIPRNPRYPSYDCSFKDENALETFEYCREFIERKPEYGLAFSLPAGYTLIDCDDVITNQGIPDELDHDIDRFNTYTEVSQSGTGLHIIGRGQPPGPIGGYDEVYSDGHWCYLTGDILDGCTNQVNDITGVLTELCDERKERISTRHKVGKDWIRTKTPGTPKNFDRRITDEYRLDVRDIGMPVNPVEVAPGIYQGENPFHGSTCGFNYRVDTRNNLWKCFRNHKSSGIEHGGGSGLELFAISEGIISCEDAKPDWFNDREIQKKVFKALEDRGYKKKESLPKPVKPETTPEPETPPAKVAKLEFNLPDNFITDYFEHATHMLDSFKEYQFVNALVVLSILVDRGAYVFLSAGAVYTNLYALLLGKTTVAGKSISINEARYLIREVYPEIVVANSPGSHVGFLDALGEEDRIKEPGKAGNGFLFNDECGALFRVMQIPSLGSFRDVLINLWDGQSINRRIKKTRLDIIDPYFGMLLATTPDTFSEVTSSVDIQSGLLPRFIVSYHMENRTVRPIRQRTKEDTKRFSIVIQQAKQYREFFKEHTVDFKITPSGLASLNEWYVNALNREQDNEHDIILAVYGRMLLYAVKIAMLMTIGNYDFTKQFANGRQKEYETFIDDDHLIQAMNIIDNYFIPNAMDLFKLVGMDNTNMIDKVIRTLQRAKDHTLDRRSLMRNTRLKSRDFQEAIDTLIESETITNRVDRNVKGSDTTFYKLVN